MRTVMLFSASLSALVFAADSPDPLEIMKHVAANFDQATEGRRQFVYKQTVRSSMVRSNGQIERRENREYSVLPTPEGVEKSLTAFHGEYRKGKNLIPYNEPEAKVDGGPNRQPELDRELLRELTDSLVNAKNTRDGVPRDLFPLGNKELPFYKFTFKGEREIRGRRAFALAFEPTGQHPGDFCVHIGDDDPCENERQWKGEAWIDATEFQPIRIETQLARGIPWGVRVFLGTNVRQLGFSLDYQRVAENVWFPGTYGTEFRLDLFWVYKRTITLSLESSDFRKTDAQSTIQFEPQ
jgi:hypothetical protein